MKRLGTALLICTVCIFWLTPLAQAGGDFQPSAEVERDQVPEQYRWNLADLYPDLAAWEAEFAGVEKDLALVPMCNGKLGGGALETRECLDRLYDLRKRVGRLDAYAFQWWTQDMRDSVSQGHRDRVVGLYARVEETGAFFDPQLQKIERAAWNEMVKKEKGLAAYNHHFKDLKRREKHLLSAQQEGLMALTIPMREGPYSVRSSLFQEIQFPRIKDEQGNEVEVNDAVFSRYRGSKDPDVRKAAVAGFFGALREYQNTLASSLATSVKGAVFEARARGYKSSLEMSLDADAVSVEVYDNLLATTAENLPRTLHRYVALRKKILGLEEMHYYDMYNPLFPASSKSYAYQDAISLIAQALKPMGQDYLTVMTRGMQPGEGWADIFPNRGKKGGAYCNAAYGTHPYVFLNYMEELDDVFTTAHEYGHAMHFYLASQAQPYAVADAPIFLAEIASTFQEEMLLDHLLKTAGSEEEKILLLNKRVENIRLTITRQTMFAEFERRIHAEVEQGGALTADRLNEIYRELIVKYFGPEFTVDENDPIEWAYIPHFYYNFYVYKYSTGLMSAIVFAKRVLAGQPGAQKQYMGLLTAGGSDYPLVILRNAGIDFARKDIVQSTYDLFAQTLDEMEALLD